jgi:CheY-like chemotaxis protein
MEQALEAMAQLSRLFLEQLPARLAEIDANLHALAKDWQAPELEIAHRGAHGLAGSAGLFGFDAISDRAHGLEVRLKVLLRDNRAPAPHEWQSIMTAFAQLQADAKTPAMTGQHAMPMPPQPGLIAAAPAQDPYRVVLIDDDRSSLQLQALILRSVGLLVATESDPLRMMQAIDAFQPDVLLLDMYMPGCTGPELAALLRARDSYRCLPILFLSAEDDAQKQHDALEMGGDDFLHKPILPKSLISMVNLHASRARLRQVQPKPG